MPIKKEVRDYEIGDEVVIDKEEDLPNNNMFDFSDYGFRTRTMAFMKVENKDK
jgi:hypothetical protein